MGCPQKAGDFNSGVCLGPWAEISPPLFLPSSLPIATATTAVVDPRAGRALPLSLSLSGVRIDVGRNDRGGGNGETAGDRRSGRGRPKWGEEGTPAHSLARSVSSPNYALPPVAIRPSLDRTRERYCSCRKAPKK